MSRDNSVSFNWKTGFINTRELTDFNSGDHFQKHMDYQHHISSGIRLAHHILGSSHCELNRGHIEIKRILDRVCLFV